MKLRLGEWKNWPGIRSDYTTNDDGLTAHFRRPEACVSMTNRFRHPDKWLWAQFRPEFDWNEWPHEQQVYARSGVKFPLPSFANIDQHCGYGNIYGDCWSTRWRIRMLKGVPILGIYYYTPYGRHIIWIRDIDARTIRHIQLGVNRADGQIVVYVKHGVLPMWWRKVLTVDVPGWCGLKPGYLWWHGWRRPPAEGGLFTRKTDVTFRDLKIATTRRDLKGRR